ncbi:hypothetical protein [Tautonia plasticadhaerens]|uniref:Carboxypeptidase regulatory-like domain-containing protein n=1 Tax=Tautonia plasticadhaerens TaxID=2527974 RepID=A0A518HF81_9BACT|nr:hypothetical protein [Tautonia plasticadhaerens]QDV39436.1 hypothetical protein ElP_74030 [Tautonia plasticadhaerens]
MKIETNEQRDPGPGLTRSGLSSCRGRWFQALAVCVGLGVAGCSSGDGEATYPVSGRVVVGGEPAAGAFLVFHPTSGSVPAEAGRPAAQVRSDGSFDLTTFDESDGAPAGDYAVTVEWRKLIHNGAEAVAGPNVVPAEYGRPESTPLKVTVVEGENPPAEFQIDVTRRR